MRSLRAMLCDVASEELEVLCPYSVLIPYCTSELAFMSVFHVIVAVEVETAVDCTALTFAGMLVKIVCASVLNSWFAETVATETPSGFDFTRKM